MYFSRVKIALGRRVVKIGFLRRALQEGLKVRSPLTRRKGPVTVVLSMGKEGHSYSAARAVKALGHRVLLVTDNPQLHEMLYSDAILLRDPITEIDTILSELEAWDLEAVMVSIKHLLLPAQSQIAERFGLISVGSETSVLNNDKLAWREALEAAGVDQPPFSRDPALFEARPCIRKPLSGTASAGVIRLEAEEDKAPHAGPGYFFEGVVDGDQFDYEGVFEKGSPRFLARVFERYIDVNGTFVAHYFLFNPPINPAQNAALERCAAMTLAASKVMHGAFHVEMRMDGARAVPIDFANRLGYERFVSFAGGEDFAQAHANCFLPQDHQAAQHTPKALVQYFCWTQEQFDMASSIRTANPDQVFDSNMTTHLVGGQHCLGMIAIWHDTLDELLKVTDGLGIYKP